MTKSDRLIAMSIVLLGTLFGTTVLAQDTSTLAMSPAIGGYSPVSYFTESKAELGSYDFSVEHNGRVYLLTSQEQVEIFRENPDKYRPRHETCMYSLAFGRIRPLDPTNFKIVGESLLLFHFSNEEDALRVWNASKLGEQELLRRADSNVFLINFD